MAEIQRFPFTPILGWSSSRYDTFSACRRRYFYQYYGKYDREHPARLIAEMKELASLPMATGSVVHEVVEAMLRRLTKTDAEIDRRRFYDFARNETAQLCQKAAFQEVYYGERPSVTVDDMYPKAHTCLSNMLDSDRYQWLATEAVASSSEWVIEPPGYGETRIDGLKAYCKVDFLFPVGGKYYIVDWKTGKRLPDKHRRQLIGYAAWATYHFAVTPASVNPVAAYLFPSYDEVEETFNEFDLQSFGLRIKAETQEMYDYCRDVEQNVPIDKEAFTKVANRNVCAHCRFRGLCFPDEFPIPRK